MSEEYKGKPSSNVAANKKDIGKMNQMNEHPEVPGTHKKRPGGATHVVQPDEKVDEMAVTRGQNGEKGNTTQPRKTQRPEKEPAH